MSQRKNVRLILPMLVLAVAFINNSPNGSANHISVENLASDFKQTRSSAVHVVRRAFLGSFVLCYTWHVTEQRTVITVTWLGVALLMGTQNFLCPTLVTRRKTSFFIFYRAQNLPSLLFFYLQTLRYRHCWSQQYAGRVSYELRPRSPWCLCGSVVEHRSAESEGPRFDSSWALRICLYSRLVTRRKKPYLQIITLLGNRRPINEDELLLIGARWWEEGEGNHLKVRNHNFINLVVSQTDHGHKKLSP